MNSTKKKPQPVVVVHIDRTPHPSHNHNEFLELAHACNTQVLKVFTFKQSRLHPATCLGRGKLELIDQYLSENPSIGAVLFNHALSPAHQRNIETYIKHRTLDRDGLILEIFAQRAQSYEGKLQVELAQLIHLSTRLIRFWTHLERQKGGIGLRGPGETQLETDKRLIQSRIKQLNKKIKKIQNRRTLQRYNRTKNQIPIIALIGYTSAGKSTLFNALNQGAHYTDDMLFATLDSTMRRINLKGVGKALLSDTVGFISDLPPELILAFRSTLEEIENANLLLHVVDCAHPQHPKHIEDVNTILSSMNVKHIPQMMVMNKIDQLPTPHPKIESQNNLPTLYISAKQQQGIEQLQNTISEQISGHPQTIHIQLSSSEGAIIDQIYTVGEVLQAQYQTSQCLMTLKITSQALKQIIGQHKKLIKVLYIDKSKHV